MTNTAKGFLVILPLFPFSSSTLSLSILTLSCLFFLFTLSLSELRGNPSRLDGIEIGRVVSISGRSVSLSVVPSPFSNKKLLSIVIQIQIAFILFQCFVCFFFLFVFFFSLVLF